MRKKSHSFWYPKKIINPMWVLCYWRNLFIGYQTSGAKKLDYDITTSLKHGDILLSDQEKARQQLAVCVSAASRGVEEMLRSTTLQVRLRIWKSFMWQFLRANSLKDTKQQEAVGAAVAPRPCWFLTTVAAALRDRHTRFIFFRWKTVIFSLLK